jgi:hypothetical protein
VNSTSAARSTDFLPKAFENAGNNATRTAEASTKLVPAQYASRVVLWRSEAMMGRETDRAEESTAAMRLMLRRPRKVRMMLVLDKEDGESGESSAEWSNMADGGSRASAVVVVVEICVFMMIEKALIKIELLRS